MVTKYLEEDRQLVKMRLTINTQNIKCSKVPENFTLSHLCHPVKYLIMQDQLGALLEDELFFSL